MGFHLSMASAEEENGERLRNLTRMRFSRRRTSDGYRSIEIIVRPIAAAEVEQRKRNRSKYLGQPSDPLGKIRTFRSRFDGRGS